jgi:hypothetical protein
MRVRSLFGGASPREVASVDHDRELDAMRWIEAVSEFDAG